MRFGVIVGKNWKDEVKGLPKDVVVHVDLEKVPDYQEALKVPNQTVIGIRPDWVGGEYPGSERERVEKLGEGIKAGADFVEIEAEMVEDYQKELLELCDAGMCGTIITKYYPAVPGKKALEEDWNKLKGKAEFLKLDCSVDSYQDCKRFLDLCVYPDLIIAGHGEKGELLGILGGLRGFYFGYCPVDKVKKALKLKLDGFGVSTFKKLETNLWEMEK